MENDDVEFDSWLRAQAAYARQRLDGFPGRAELSRRVRELRGDHADHRGFAAAGGRMFWMQRDPDRTVAVLMVRDGAARTLLDPEQVVAGPRGSLDWYVPSPDGRYVACCLSSGGSEAGTIRVVDASDGTLLNDAVGEGRVNFPFVSWLPDGVSFMYHRFAGVDRTDSRTCLHRLGDDPANDTVVLARGLNPQVPLTPRDRPLVYRPPGGDVLLAVISHGALRGDRVDNELSSCTLYLAPLDGLSDPAACEWTLLAGADDLVTAFAFSADTVFLASRRDAPRGQVLAAPLRDPQRRRVHVPESSRVIDALRVIDADLLIREHDSGTSRLRRVSLEGGAPREVLLPVDGDLDEWADGTEPGSLLLRIESWRTAPRVYRWDVRGDDMVDTGWGEPTPDGFDDVVVTRTEASGRDGTPIPLTLIHREGMPRAGGSPTLLTAYGSYGISLRPMFVPGMLAWLEQGGVWAMAHVRGGGEHGEDWHRSGRMSDKENTIADVVDCAEHLVAQGCTSPRQLAVFGASAGGIAVGGALVRRPELFAAVVLHVPLVDTLRFEFAPNGPVNVPEFGSVSTEEGFHSLRIADSCRRVRDGVDYPAVLLTAGRNDPRVPPWQPAKLAARLQAATASARPVLLRVEDDGGHGLDSAADLHDDLLADELAFLSDQLRQ